MSQYTPEEHRLLGPGYRGLLLFSLFLICSFNFADRAVIAVLAQSIRVDLELTDFDLGLLQGLAFALLYAGLGIPFGRLAEHFNRLKILVAVTALWSAATALCGLTQNFIQLMLARFGVGMGEAGFLPTASSLVADHFPAKRRATAMSIVMLGTPAGTFFGALIAGWVAQEHSWRHAFYALGIPGVVTAALVYLVLREPPRGLVDNLPRVPTPVPRLGEFARVMMERRALRYIVIGGAFTGFVMTTISSFMNVFLQRMYHLPVRESGALYGTISGLSITLGLVIGALSSDWLAQRDKRWSAWIAMAGLFSSPIVYYFAFRADTVGEASALLTAAAAALLLFYGPTLGMVQNLLEPKMRASGIAVFSTFYTLVGAGFGPPIVGFLSDRFAQGVFGETSFVASCPGGVAPTGSAPAAVEACANASAIGIQQALTVAVASAFIACLCYFLASRTLRDDLYVAVPAAVPATAR
ncbi:MAG: MFS transporter [Gammaproteobacteria bacterium]